MSSSLKNKKVEEWRTRKILMKRFKELLKRLLKKKETFEQTILELLEKLSSAFLEKFGARLTAIY